MQVLITELMRVCVNTICGILDTNNAKSISLWTANLIGNDSHIVAITTQIDTLSIYSGTFDGPNGMITHLILILCLTYCSNKNNRH